MINSSQISGMRGDNKSINPFFRKWQRYTGTPFVSSGYYTADRYRLSRGTGCTATVDQIAGTVIEERFTSEFGLEYAFTTDGSAASYVSLEQRVERVDTLRGAVTIKIIADIPLGNSIGLSIRQNDGSTSTYTEVPGLLVGTGVVTSYERTVNLSEINEYLSGSYVGVQAYLSAGSSYASRTSVGVQPNGTVNFYAFIINPGPHALPCVRRHDAIEDALCYRYCQLYDFAANQRIASIYAVTGNYVYGFMPMLSEMRTGTPSYDFSSLSDFDIQLGIDTYTNPITLTLGKSTASVRRVYMQFPSGSFVGNIGNGGAVIANTSDAYFLFEDEL